MRTNALKYTGVKSEHGTTLLTPGILSERTFFVHVLDVVTDKKIHEFLLVSLFKPRQEAAERSYESEMAIFCTFAKKEKNIEYFKLHCMPVESSSCCCASYPV